MGSEMCIRDRRLLASRDDRFFTVAIDCLLGIADLEVADTL